MFMHYMINWVLEKSFDLPLLQFVDDIQKNLEKELDFRIEANNAKLGSKKFQQTRIFYFQLRSRRYPCSRNN